MNWGALTGHSPFTFSPLKPELKHENIIGLVDVFGHKSNISLGTSTYRKQDGRQK